MRQNKNVLRQTGWKLGAGMLTAALMLSGCGGGSDSKEAKPVSLEGRYALDPETPAWKADKKAESTALTWYVNADWWNTDFGKDLVTKKIKEDLNVDIKFITGDDTKLNTFFAGGDMPDLITVFDSNSAVAQKAATWALPLNDLAEQYDPYFNKVAQRRQDLRLPELFQHAGGLRQRRDSGQDGVCHSQRRL